MTVYDRIPNHNYTSVFEVILHMFEVILQLTTYLQLITYLLTIYIPNSNLPVQCLRN